MSNALDLIKLAKHEAEKRKRSQPTVVEIGAIVSKLKEVEWETLPLAELESYAGKLTGYMFSLSKVVCDSTLEHNASYIHRKLQGAKLYFEVDAKTVKEREMLSEKANYLNYHDELVANYYSDTITHLSKNVDRMISTIQSIMSNRRSEMRTTNTQT